MNDIQLHRIDLNLLVTFEALMETGSVSVAARNLGKTPSAVSHALARLRDQIGDPLMVKVNGRMQPSPFAERLIGDVRPILRAIKRAVQPPEPFDPATSTRVFRVSLPAMASLIIRVYERVNAEAPGVALEWLPQDTGVYAKVADEQIDLGLLGAEKQVPEGITEHVLPPLRRYVVARADHPALQDWSRAAWLRWPHIMVDMSGAGRQTVEEGIAKQGIERRIGARVPEFSAMAPILEHTDLIANFPPFAVLDGLRAGRLRLLEPPEPLPQLAFRFFWSTRLSNDPGNQWLRRCVIQAYTEVFEEEKAFLANAEIVPVRGDASRA